ncbi:BrnA antitoxin family protein [Devosia rhizoryzae]|uniref:BrnA antitoxin family protein n=1 Tax=Devosia rhizoryzae TaxID=2774137 RepID=A0ABX7C4B5_9HYPH|nr:BrnA antitoxin family protein [Devosia rhizoryzae]QQR39078.1 BrnA antitoxin family protein [Devosia rhizoryzae]
MTKFSSKRPLTDAEEAEIQAMIAGDPDNPEISDDEAKNPMSFSEALARGPGRPRLANAKEPVTLRLDPQVIDSFKKGGDDWRARMAEAITKAAG